MAANPAIRREGPADLLKLHGIVVIWGFTSIIGVLMTIPAVEIVFYRTAIAAVVIAGILIVKNLPMWPGRAEATKLFCTGFLIGAHWILFFLSAKVASASISVIGLATCTFWTALFLPLFFRTYRWNPSELALGVVMFLALWLIYRQLDSALGLVIAIGSALCATVFSIINGLLIRRHHYLMITFYEMAGAAAICALFFPVYLPFLSTSGAIELPAGFVDWMWMLVLSVVCTVFAYTVYVALLERLSVFTINVSSNMEPVYGILLAAVILKEHQRLTVGFYCGSAIIVAAIFGYQWIKYQRAGAGALRRSANAARRPR